MAKRSIASKTRAAEPKNSRARQRLIQRASPSGEVLKQQSAVTDPAHASPSALLSLQGAYGNQAVQRLIQTKLTVGAADDMYEQEADRVASEVLSRSTVSQSDAPTSTVARESDDEKAAQRKTLATSITPVAKHSVAPTRFDNKIRRADAPGNDLGGSFDAGPAVEVKLAASAGGGSPLPDGTRSAMEPHFGKDFSSVRLHAGSEAAMLNRQLGAKAFTHQNHIYLGEGASAGDKGLMAHELTHVVQQGGATANKLQTKLTVGPAGDRSEQEADAVAAHVMRTPATPQKARNGQKQKLTPQAVSARAEAGGPRVQRLVDAEIMQMNGIRGKYFGGRTAKVIKWLTKYNDHMHSGARPGKDQKDQLMMSHASLLDMTRSREKKGTDQAAGQNAVIGKVANSVARELQMLGQYLQITGGKKLGSGQVNTVWKVLFGDGWEGVWKEDESKLGENAGTAQDSGISEQRANMGSRNIAMYRLDQLLGTGVIPRTERAGWGAKAGTVMQMVKGQQLGSTEMGGAEGKTPVGQKNLDVDYANAAVQRGLSNLQVLDAIAGQVDRHGGNVMVETDGAGRILGIRGIDNDFAFGTNVKADQSGKISHERGMPKHVDLRTAQRMVKVTDDMVRQTLAGQLSEAEIEKTVERFQHAQSYCKTLLRYSAQGELTGGGVVSHWDKATYDEQMRIAQEKVDKAGGERFGFSRNANESYLWTNAKSLVDAKGYIAKGDKSFKLVDVK